MVAGHEDRFASAAEPRADRLEHGLGDAHRVRGASLEQLDHVAEQHQPVDSSSAASNRSSGSRLGEHAVLHASAEVQVGDDERSHATSR